MAMRLRVLNGKWVALCAAKAGADIGDVYIDDAQDHAIRAKLSHDNRLEGLEVPVVDAELDAIMLGQETSVKCTAYPINGCAHPQFCKDGCKGTGG